MIYLPEYIYWNLNYFFKYIKFYLFFLNLFLLDKSQLNRGYNINVL